MRLALMSLALLAMAGGSLPAQSRPRARDLGIAPGSMTPGPLNAITDVAGVLVGHTTVVRGDTVRTGVTAVLPHGRNLFKDKVPGAVFVGNAFGKLAGSAQVQELGTIESPIVLTNTLSVGIALDAVVRWTMSQAGNENVRSVNALIGETNDAGLNDIRGLHVTREHVLAAVSGARPGAVDEGGVGAGTGTVAFGWKGGIGTSSRIVRQGPETYTVGVLVQSNYGGKLTISGVPVWKDLTPHAPGDPMPGTPAVASIVPPPIARRTSDDARRTSNVARPPSDPARRPSAVAGRTSNADGSCMIVVATDAPLDARDLGRLAARAIFAMARTGSTYSNGSGDFAIAFSTHPALRVDGSPTPQTRMLLPTDSVSGLFEATLDATEEAIYNSMLKADDTTSGGRTIRALPIPELRSVLAKYGR